MPNSIAMRLSMSAVLVAGSLSLFGGCSTKLGPSIGQAYAQRDVDQARLFAGMGDHHREVTTSSPLAQRYFDQGLTWAYTFNHDEAIRSFTEATRLDPDCAMAWWGIALCHGPHINNPSVPPERAKAAWTALQRAVSLKARVSHTERSLIEALAHRYTDPPPEDRKPLDEAYAEAMGKVWEANRTDSDIGTLYAEALMDLHPWDLWTKDGKPRTGAEQIVSVLEEVLALDVNHPGANHLYIHMVEASGDPARANAAADRLRRLVPGAGHLVHMPSHIDVLTGRWHSASVQNQRAVLADQRYRRQAPQQGFYRLYMVHNHHMLAFSAMMEGRAKVALEAVHDIKKSIPQDFVRENVILMDPFMASLFDVLKRFGRWDDILAQPSPPEYLPITTAMWRFNRGVAFAAKGRIAQAEQERAAFGLAVSQIPEGRIMVINKASYILRIAEHFLNGEIAFRRGDIDEA